MSNNSDFTRLYYILTSFIPFECFERTKKFYKLKKKQFAREKVEKEILSKTESVKKKTFLKTASLMGLGSLGFISYFLFKSHKNVNKNN